MKAILFCRVSSREQEDEGYSLPSQEKLLREYASKKDIHIDKVFTVSESASGQSQRKAFHQMMTFINKNNISIIICEKTDRFTRNLKDAVTIYKWLDVDEKRQLHLVKDSLILHKNSRSQEKLNLDMRVVFAKNYVDNLSEEVKKGQKSKIENGWCPQGNPPIGYKAIRKEGKSIQVVDHDTSYYIVKMFQLFSTGEYSVNTLSDKMYELGLRSRYGNKLKGKDIHRYLTNVFYIGKFIWNGSVYTGSHEPLISEAMFNRVQKLLKRERPPKYRKHNHLFKSMIFCKECRSTITWEIHKGISYGHCTHFKPCTQKIWVKDYEIENQVTFALSLLEIKNERLREWIFKGLCEKYQLDSQFNTKIKEQLEQNVQKIKNKLDTLIDMRADGEISKETYLLKKAETQKDLEELQKQLLNSQKGDDDKKKLKLEVFKVSQNAIEEYKKKKPERKRALLK